jgi:hypothetical protein
MALIWFEGGYGNKKEEVTSMIWELRRIFNLQVHL